MRSKGLSSLTVIIPTVSRPMFVLRQFRYWRISDAQVVILDGAKSPIQIPKDLESPNIRYIHTGTSFNERLAMAGQYVVTPYCALLADDEFFLFSGLHAAINRLQADPETLGCVGRCLGFFVDQGRFLTRDMYREWRPFSNSANSPEARLDEDLPPNKTHMATYSIMRSRDWVEIFKNSYQKAFSCAYTYERLTNLQRSIRGRTEILEDLLWMRSWENSPVVDQSMPRTGVHNLVAWARSQEFLHEVLNYRSIARQLLISGGVTSPAADIFEQRFFIGGIQRQATKEAKNKRKFSTFVRYAALNYTPQVLRTLAKQYVPNRVLAFSGWQGFELDEMFQLLEEWGTRFDREELSVVRQLSLELHASILSAGQSLQ